MNRCSAKTKSNLLCKRNCMDNTDFCRQHSPLNKLDDITCAICLEDIKNPMNIGCSHVFCKECISKSILYNSPTCPCCRNKIWIDKIYISVKHLLGKKKADVYLLSVEMQVYTKWSRSWTKTMTNRYNSVMEIE